MSAPASAAPSMAATLRRPLFRRLWASGGLFYIGNAMQTMAAAWMMVELTGSSFLAALVQTAVFLPMCLLALPAGVLADIADRRRLLMRALATQAATGLLLAALLLAGVAGPGLVLALVFVIGCCTALLSPAWNSALIDAVPAAQMPQAITANAIAFNAARALGPAIAGLVYAQVGGAWNFALAVLTVLAMVATVRRHPPRPHPPSRLPAERLWGGVLSALRFARHSRAVFAQLVRTVAYSGTGSALWALLPVIGQRHLGLGAEGYGLLMACLGGGAVAAGLAIGAVRQRLGVEATVRIACIVYAAVMLATALLRWPPAVYGALVVGGAVWMSAMSTFNTTTQSSAPPWVRARAMALHTVSALGSFAIGSALWGALSGLIGLETTLVVAALGMAAGALLGAPLPLRMGAQPEVTPASPAEALALAAEPSPQAGPVAVELVYRIRPETLAGFLEAAARLREPRRRDGATFWRLYRDLSTDDRYVERFIVASWADYLHQRARATQADEALEAQVRACLAPGATVAVHHYLAER